MKRALYSQPANALASHLYLHVTFLPISNLFLPDNIWIYFFWRTPDSSTTLLLTQQAHKVIDKIGSSGVDLTSSHQ